MEKRNELLELTFEFSIAVVEYSELLEMNRKYVLARQTLKSGTSIGASVREAQSAESLADFIHKMKIADKEALETEYWLLICKQSKNYPDPEGLMETNIRIRKLLNSIIRTSKSRQKTT
jgi:four helix bundle protein